ncbi:MAG: hypothetical protein HOV80_05000, partial [Polyangiaceae bacterium]|nr:hypothetical protein [Polyangiaceae bacterium]
MLRSCALASVVACGLVGCALDFDAIGFTGGGGEGASSTTSSDVTGSGSSSSSGSTATGPGECDEAGECLPPAPAGWVGPGALFEDSACPVGQVPLFEGGDDGTATSCPCSPVGPVCTNAYVSFFDDEECMTTRA